MSRYCGEHNVAPILDAAAHWRDVALARDGSVFTEGPIWTTESLEALERYFVKNLDEGQGSFLEKLYSQLMPTEPHVKRLAAEMQWVMLLCPSNILAATKREAVGKIWSWSEESLPPTASQSLSEAVLSGVGSAGPVFNNHRWRELVFFINAMLRLLGKVVDRRDDHDVLEGGLGLRTGQHEVDGLGDLVLGQADQLVLGDDVLDRALGPEPRLVTVSSSLTIFSRLAALGPRLVSASTPSFYYGADIAL
jgi:hypothetical protein